LPAWRSERALRPLSSVVPVDAGTTEEVLAEPPPHAAQPTPTVVEREQAIERLNAVIADRYEQALRLAGSPIVADPQALGQLLSQVRTVVAEVLAEHWHDPAQELAYATAAVRLSTEIGATRAGAGIHPTESLAAASVLFDTALEVLQAELGTDRVPALSRLLHRVIMDRVVQGAVSYVNFLLRKVRESHQEERQRLSRELHDRVAHCVRVGLQNIELFELYAGSDPDRAADKLAAATEALVESVDMIGALAAELRASVGSQGLDRALSLYLAQHAPTGTTTSVSCAGPVLELSPVLNEELFIVLRESLRNALVHGQPTTVSLSIVVTDSDVTAVVTDDGKGFDLDAERAEPSGIGLSSMRERMELLGGAVAWSRPDGPGTIVQVRVSRARTGP
jgi:signal transduction histidine kinase